jgi:hypothetical protein
VGEVLVVVLLSGTWRTGGNTMQVKGGTGSCLVEREARWLREDRAAGRNDRKCEPSVVHIPCLWSCDAFLEFMYRL